MSLTDIKTKNQGFTIVELLIVVVVIAILAAITIVSYNGITTRANASAAASAAGTVQKKAELYAADGPTSAYPLAIANLTGAAGSTTYSLTGITSVATVTPTNGKTSVQYEVCGTGAADAAPANLAAITAGTGAIIRYYNYEAGSGTKNVTVGQTSGVVGTKTIACFNSPSS